GVAGGWGYNCPELAQDEVKRLGKLLKERDDLAADGKLPKGGGKIKLRDPNEVTKEILQQIMQVNRQVMVGFGPAEGDNSNTQFATLALWVARKYGMPVG